MAGEQRLRRSEVCDWALADLELHPCSPRAIVETSALEAHRMLTCSFVPLPDRFGATRAEVNPLRSLPTLTTGFLGVGDGKRRRQLSIDRTACALRASYTCTYEPST